jgi:hypothetical protein
MSMSMADLRRISIALAGLLSGGLTAFLLA